MLEAMRERLPALDVPWTLGEVQVRLGRPLARLCALACACTWVGGPRCAESMPLVYSTAFTRPLQACHISAWNATHLAQHEHVTSTRDPGLRKVLKAAAGRGRLGAAARPAPS